MPILQLKNLTQRFGGLVAVSNVDYVVDEGRIDSLIGPNGAGKTTVFNAVTGLVEPTSGEIEFQGEDIRLPFSTGVAIACLLIALVTGLASFVLSLNVDQLWRASIKRTAARQDQPFTYAAAWSAAVGYYRGELNVERTRLGRWIVTSADGRMELASANKQSEAELLRADLELLLADGAPPPAFKQRAGRWHLLAPQHERSIASSPDRAVVERKWMQFQEFAAARNATTLWTSLAFLGGLALGGAGSLAIWMQSRRTPDVIARRGIARTFQNIRLFKDMTVLENVLVSLDQRQAAQAGWLSWLSYFSWSDAAELAEAQALLQFVGLGERHPGEIRRQSMLAKNLPYGDQRRLEIARALALEPKLLLLDEPAAGMNPAESLDLLWLIRTIRDRGVTILLIEHHMRVVMDISDYIGVLHQGVKIASGTPAEIRANPAVIEAYLGSEEVS